ncbi:hypothetical protein L7F22_055487 [Adiantum nelumboides]|nr:hypothetical protein [Adiantum nelumboides]
MIVQMRFSIGDYATRVRILFVFYLKVRRGLSRLPELIRFWGYPGVPKQELQRQQIVAGKFAEDVLDLDDGEKTKFANKVSNFDKAIDDDLCIEEEAKQVMIVTHKDIRKRIEKVPLQGLEVDVDQAYMLLPMLLEFCIEMKSYILLTDEQMLFDLHEDYALGMLAIYFDEQHGFVEEDSSDDKRLETNPNMMECLKHCFEEARRYKESKLPRKSTFKSLQEKMQLHKYPHSALKWMKKQVVEERVNQ